MSERFFSDKPISGERLTLDGPEAHHLLHVMRAAKGQRVTLFDDTGGEFEAVIEKLWRSSVELRIVARHAIDRELPFALTVGVSLPKGERQKWLVEKLTELGATTLVPLSTERSVAQPTAAALERLSRTVIEAAKQCGRNRLMKIAKPQAWREWVSQEPPAGELRSPDRRLIAHPGGKTLSQLNLVESSHTRLAIGPEGGLTDEEIASAIAAGWEQVDLGPRILRVETAAVALSAAVVLSARGAVE